MLSFPSAFDAPEPGQGGPHRRGRGKDGSHGQQGSSRKAVLSWPACPDGRWLSNHFALETHEGGVPKASGNEGN